MIYSLFQVSRNRSLLYFIAFSIPTGNIYSLQNCAEYIKGTVGRSTPHGDGTSKRRQVIWNCQTLLETLQFSQLRRRYRWQARIVMPPFSGAKYLNYKKYFSIVLLAVADAEYRFTVIDVGSYGSSSDSAIFKRLKLGQLLMANKLHIPAKRPWPGTIDKPHPFVLVEDEAFGIGKHYSTLFKTGLKVYQTHILLQNF